jgi:hypothetical protein
MPKQKMLLRLVWAIDELACASPFAGISFFRENGSLVSRLACSRHREIFVSYPVMGEQGGKVCNRN